MALAASVAGIRNDFAMDDVHLIAEDPRVHSLFGLEAVFVAPYWPEPFNRDLYRPLSTLSFALQWALGGGSPLVFRVTSYLLYALVSLGVLSLGRRLLPAGVALAIALLFAAHPVHVEAVALGVNQAEQWVALLALVGVIRYLDLRRRGWPTPRDWALLGGVYGVACLFKEHAVAIPGLLVAAEVTVIGGARGGERIRRLWPGFAAMLALGGGFLAVRTAVLGSFVGSFTAEALLGQGAAGRAMTMLQVVPEWLRLLLWPAHLQGDYSPAAFVQATYWGGAQTAGVLILAALLAVGWSLRRKAPSVPFGLLWAAGALLPVSNLVVPTGILMAERALFLPSVGFLLALGGILAATVRLPAGGAPGRARHLRLWGTATAALVIAGVARSAVRHTDWRDHLHFWARTVEDAPLSHKAHYAYGQLLYGSGEEDAGLEHYHVSVALHPAAHWIQRELGDLYRMRGECAAALHWYAESLRVEPRQASARLSRVACLMQLGRLEEAMQEAELAVQNPEPARTPAREGSAAPPR